MGPAPDSPMRQVAVAVVIAGFMFVAPSATAVAGGTAEVSPGTPLTTAETLLGAWTGQWRAADGTPGGSLGLVLARVPGRDTVVGQFTFIAGAVSGAAAQRPAVGQPLCQADLRFLICPLVDLNHAERDEGFRPIVRGGVTVP